VGAGVVKMKKKDRKTYKPKKSKNTDDTKRTLGKLEAEGKVSGDWTKKKVQ